MRHHFLAALLLQQRMPVERCSLTDSSIVDVSDRAAAAIVRLHADTAKLATPYTNLNTFYRCT